MAILWPLKVLQPQNRSPFFLRGMNISGPVSASGAADVISGDASFWIATFSDIIVTTEQRLMAFRGIRAKAQGRLNPIIVPNVPLYRPVVPGYNGKPLPHSDGAFFSDGSGYVSAGTDVRTVADLPKDAIAGNVSVRYAGLIQPGHVFSFGDRMYEVTDVSANRLWWQPPLREAVDAGSILNFTSPRCQMRLASDDEMRLETDVARRGFPTVNFVEDLVP